MNRKSKEFVPSTVGQLEDRVVLSGVNTFHGIPVLTQTVYARAYTEIANAFNRFGNQFGGNPFNNFAGLNYHLNRAVGSIPYHLRDGLNAQLSAVVNGLQTGFFNGAPNGAVTQAQLTALSLLGNQVGNNLLSGRVIYSPR
jgi:hypothetical protein